MPVIEHAPKSHVGVTTLMAVGGPDGLGQTATRLQPMSAIKDGLLVMGISVLIGVKPKTARLLGLLGLGIGLLR